MSKVNSNRGPEHQSHYTYFSMDVPGVQFSALDRDGKEAVPYGVKGIPTTEEKAKTIFGQSSEEEAHVCHILSDTRLPYLTDKPVLSEESAKEGRGASLFHPWGYARYWESDQGAIYIVNRKGIDSIFLDGERIAIDFSYNECVEAAAICSLPSEPLKLYVVTREVRITVLSGGRVLMTKKNAAFGYLVDPGAGTKTMQWWRDSTAITGRAGEDPVYAPKHPISISSDGRTAVWLVDVSPKRRISATVDSYVFIHEYDRGDEIPPPEEEESTDILPGPWGLSIPPEVEEQGGATLNEYTSHTAHTSSVQPSTQFSPLHLSIVGTSELSTVLLTTTSSKGHSATTTDSIALMYIHSGESQVFSRIHHHFHGDAAEDSAYRMELWPGVTLHGEYRYSQEENSYALHQTSTVDASGFPGAGDGYNLSGGVTTTTIDGRRHSLLFVDGYAQVSLVLQEEYSYKKVVSREQVFAPGTPLDINSIVVSHSIEYQLLLYVKNRVTLLKKWEKEGIDDTSFPPLPPYAPMPVGTAVSSVSPYSFKDNPGQHPYLSAHVSCLRRGDLIFVSIPKLTESGVNDFHAQGFWVLMRDTMGDILKPDTLSFLPDSFMWVQNVRPV